MTNDFACLSVRIVEWIEGFGYEDFSGVGVLILNNLMGILDDLEDLEGYAGDFEKFEEF